MLTRKHDCRLDGNGATEKKNGFRDLKSKKYGGMEYKKKGRSVNIVTEIEDKLEWS